jgi:uncharacterized membrane protein YfcA
MDLRYSLAGLFVGILIGLTGMGGGSLLAPILILFFRVPPVWAVSTDLAYSTVTKAVGSLIHIRAKHVNFKIAFWLACGSVPATFLSVFLVQYVKKQYGSVINGFIIHAIGFVLILVAVVLFLRPYIMRSVEKKSQEAQKQAALAATAAGSANKPEATRWESFYRPLITALIGAIVGIIVGFTSVGSGTLIVVSIFTLYPKLTTKELVGTDIFQGFMLVTAGAVAYLFAGTINWTITGLLLIGSLPGVIIGSQLSKYIPNRYMRPVLAVVLAVSGFKLI